MFNQGGSLDVSTDDINTSSEIVVNVYLMAGTHHFIYCINESDVDAFTPFVGLYEEQKWLSIMCVNTDIQAEFQYTVAGECYEGHDFCEADTVVTYED